MKIDFFWHEARIPCARAGNAAWRALAGFLDSDVGSPDNASATIGALERSLRGGATVNETGNAFTVTTRGSTATVECAIDESMPPVSLAARSLIELLNAWISFMQNGRPTTWKSD